MNWTTLYRISIGLLLALCTASPSAESVRLPTTVIERTKLPNVLLSAALERGERYHVNYPYGEIDSLPISTRINDVRNGHLDVFSTMTSAAYEAEFQAVYIPIYRGLMGMRLALVSRAHRDIFNGVTTLSALAHFNAGQGKLWADADILEANGLPVVRELKYANLFRMLEAERFDYFPRAIHEPWAELYTWSQLDLVVADHLMLKYEAPFYFFFRKQDKELVAHVNKQLEGMLEDGSFLELFYQDTDVRAALTKAGLDKRTIIELKNPFLTSATPLQNKALWFDPSELPQRLNQQGGRL